ncbi:MAG: SDR family oxidoreductase [Alphaproteobacteria bacterium]|nr:SDR family oxidoreductase [Alphaproteobacteria bacterium]
MTTTVLITGANRGLGLEFTHQYAAEGARVLACARHPGEAKALLDFAAASKGKVTVHPLDVASDASVAHLASDIGAEPIDILINNAGVYGGDHQRLGDIDYETWIRTMSVNALGPVRVIETLRGNLVKGRDKKVIAITSAMGSNTRHDGAALIYRSSKAALNNAMRGLSIALKADGIIVVPMHPGWVQTDMGGASAPLTPKQSIAEMRRVISGLSPSDSGRYLNYDGTEIDW